jgi:non-heme chloroperoxidase
MCEHTGHAGRRSFLTGKVLRGVVDNWWREGMMGGAKAHYDGIKAFSETDFTEDLKSIGVPTLVMHGDDTTHAEVINRDLLVFIKA